MESKNQTERDGRSYDPFLFHTNVERFIFPPHIKSSPVDPNEPEKDCDLFSLACGWAVYIPFTKELKDYMKNA